MNTFSTIFARIFLVLVGLFIGILVVDLFFIACPARLPPLVQVMALRGPWGEQIRIYNGLLRRQGNRFGLDKKQVWIRNHPDFPDHLIETFPVPGVDLFVRDARATPPWDALAVGDSFTFGYGTREDQSFVARLEENLHRSILNTGVPGYASQDALESMRKVLSVHQIRLVIYFLYPNDLSDDVSLAEAKPVAIGGAPAAPLHSIRAILSRWSASYELLKLIGKLGDYHQYDSSNRFLNTQNDRQLVAPGYLKTADHDGSDNYHKGLNLLKQDIQTMAAEARKQGSRFAVVYIPSREQIYVDADAENQQPQKDLRLWFTGKTIPFLDLTTSLQSRKDIRPLYFNYDRHLSVAGHEAVAKEVTDFLRKGKLIRETRP